MGWGDEIMASAHAAVEARRLGGPVHVLDRRGLARWSLAWGGCPAIARPEEPAVGAIRHGSGCRPYIDYARSTPDRWAFHADYRVPGPGWSPVRWNGGSGQERPVVIVEPHLKAAAPSGKQWGWDRWQALVAACPSVDWRQLGPAGVRLLDGAVHLPTPTIAAALVALSLADAAVLPEGGLHHAAAAVRLPAVVIYGGFIRPETTGYAGQVAHWIDAPDALGWRVAHPACQAAMARIEVDAVAGSLRRLLADGLVEERGKRHDG